MSAFFGRIIRATYGQHPIAVLLSEEKGVGKTFALKQALWMTASLNHIYNNSTSPEYILSKAATTTLLLGLEDTASTSKEERLFVGELLNLLNKFLYNV
jgi:hypothetical protein